MIQKKRRDKRKEEGESGGKGRGKLTFY